MLQLLWNAGHFWVCLLGKCHFIVHEAVCYLDACLKVSLWMRRLGCLGLRDELI